MLRLRHAQLAARRFASSAAAAPESVVELRTYTLHPAGMKSFLDLSAEYAELRARLNPGFKGCARDAAAAAAVSPSAVVGLAAPPFAPRAC